RLLLAEFDGGGPDEARAAGEGVPGMAGPLPAGCRQRRAENAVYAGSGDRPQRSADRSPRRVEPEPCLVHAEHRRRLAGEGSRAQGARHSGRPPRRRGAAPRRERGLRRRTLAGLVRRLPALDAVARLKTTHWQEVRRGEKDRTRLRAAVQTGEEDR